MDASLNAVVAGTRRRNGKIPSCEPCRKGKIRCDHQRPVCARCRRRGLDAQCFFHPAPLTKPRDQTVSVAARPIFDTPTVVRSDVIVDHTSSSSTSAAPKVTSAPVLTLPCPLPAFPGHGDDAAHEDHYRMVRALVQELQHLELLHKVLHEYYALTTAALVPGFLILPAISGLHNLWSNAQDRDELLDSVSREMLQSTRASVAVQPHTTIDEFCAQQHGHNLSVEMLGLLYTVAARSCLYGLARDEENRDIFIKRLFDCSNQALRLSRDTAPRVTDSLVWLQFENLLFSNALNGDGNSSSWRRLGDLATDVMELGLHRESTYADLPFFLEQTRRKTFAGSYNLDKLMASMHERPPRIYRRFMDCGLPLDISDDIVLATDRAQANPFKHVMDDGWSITGEYASVSWNFPETNEKLRELSLQNDEAWKALPKHLRYTPECWTSGLPTTLCIMLTSTFLSYQQLNFQIFRHLEANGPSSIKPLIRVAAEILATILHVGSFRDRAWYMHFDFEFLMLAYGIPSGLTLAAALERCAQSNISTIPAELSRSGLIRNLSVFVSMLESWHGVAETNKRLCTESAKAISQTLDRVLDAPPKPTPTIQLDAGTTTQSSQATEPADMAAPDTHAMELSVSNIGIPLSDSEGFDMFDLSHWPNNIDWTSLGNDWATF